MNSQNTQQVSRRFVTQELAHIEIYGKNGRIMTKMSNLSASGAFFEVISPNFTVKKGDIARVTISLKSLNLKLFTKTLKIDIKLHLYILYKSNS